MKYSYLTDSGRVRDHNEDNVIIVKNDSNEYFELSNHGRNMWIREINWT